MDTEECIKTRADVREYKDQPVKAEALDKILEAGIQAPSSGNVQDWRFIVVRNGEMKARVSEAALNQEFIRDAPLVIVVCSDQDSVAGAYGGRGVNLYSIQNTACAIENMVLAAWNQGIGSCWVGAFNEVELKKILNVPINVRPMAIITFGYPARPPKKHPRKPAGDVTYLEEYGRRI